ncbi:flagellar assembly peptidoglycan hydrolase FlgJ [Herbaspirillum sp. RTI4]|uniref:flagellar assembly peptidoglycan hydrolase FlgJ n=1 Tax=Herbaspirillum sp. RTI4 TaxID=3048640 RepID=UPI002AB346CA|nr:flagellar assembly peptidoglycan hydrolase FlgJ [Herbaspirillum sp. RTI4]MDY7578304.1 flagellar assembly peptidoglycan hydrolase FlgJ [Herbaspirillum sp. RTI4]MEA9981203.1 flagellar assembly peptidoglycan hydrolase FlgJ [Herbaspirillum sp. RTI4]
MVNNINDNKAPESLAIDANGLNKLRLSAQQNSPEAIKGVAKQFEGMFLNMVMKSMRDATPQDGPFDSQQSKMFTSMLDQQLSQSLAQRGVGLAEVLIKQLSNKANMPTGLEQGDEPSASTPSLLDHHTMSELDKARLTPHSGAMTGNGSADADGKNNAHQGRKKNQPRAAHVEAFQSRLQADAEEASRTTGIPATFMLAQAALETGWGKREIFTRDGGTSHNLFGVKATGNWTGKVVEANTTEYVNGVPHRKLEKFRAYDSYADAFRDYAQMLRSNPRYEKVLANAQDINGFAHGLQRAGYATDPHYADKLTRIIRQSLAV